MNNTSAPSKPPPAATWWITWLALIIGVTAIYNVMQPEPDASQAFNGALRYLPVVPLFLSVIVRWFVLSRFKHTGQAFSIYIIGLALAESCAILGIFLVPSLKATYFALGLLGIAQFIPLFANRFKA